RLASAEIERPATYIQSDTVDGEEDQQIELFSYVSDRARERAEAPFKAVETPPGFIRNLSYDAYRLIDFRPEESLFRDLTFPYKVMFDTRGSLFHTPIKVNVVSERGAREVPYEASQFDFEPLELTDEEKSQIGYAGFRLLSPLNRGGKFDEVMSVKGASFFRALGTDNRYGASARGISIKTASPEGEEFPEFREFWLQEPKMADQSFVFHALMDGPSVTGAYQFRVQPGVQTKVEVQATIYARKDTNQIGLAPLTSMFEFGPQDPKPASQDFRPRVHDSEGFAAMLDNGEWIWRPLSNPEKLQISTFATTPPKGFGLVQRARAFEQYEDIEAAYEARPSVWVTPGEGWRDGQLVLVEIPTPNEYNDNIISYWKLSEPLLKGDSMSFSYEMDWGLETPFNPPLAEVHATRTGMVEGENRQLFVVDFDVADATALEDVTASVSTSAGEISAVTLTPDTKRNRVRLSFELDAMNGENAELRAVLNRSEHPFSETWLYRRGPA
ncbi:MAG: glucan biosynthesis protein D, partial [Ponticaulis sp.]|nr:glucan biosynthesis protein D [Ponticaulis sp.]